MISIQSIGKESIPVIHSLSHQIWPVTYSTILTEGQISYMLERMYSYESLTDQIAGKNHQFVLAIENNRPVGFASFGQKSTEEPTRYRIHKIYILPELQGKGIGKKILQFIAGESIPMGAEILELNVNKNNPAKVFYEKMGFCIEREEKIDIGQGYFMDDYVMSTSLAGNLMD